MSNTTEQLQVDFLQLDVDLQTLEDQVISSTFDHIFGLRYPQVLGSPKTIDEKKAILTNLKTIKDQLGLDRIKGLMLKGEIVVDSIGYTVNQTIHIVDFLANIAENLSDSTITINELRQFQKDMVLNNTQLSISQLQQNITESGESMNIKVVSTFDIISGTTFASQMESIIKPQTVENYCKSIDDIWRQYITNFDITLKQLDASVIDNMATGISFFMIQQLANQNTQTQSDFWSAIEGLGPSPQNQTTLTGVQNFMTQTFGALNKTGGGISIFKKLVSFQKILVQSGLTSSLSKQSPILTNPTKFVEFVNQIPEDIPNADMLAWCARINPQTTQGSQPTSIETMTEQNKTSLQNIANTIKFDKNMYNSLEQFKSYASDFLKQQSAYKQVMSTSVEAVFGDQSIINQIMKPLQKLGLVESAVGVDRLASDDFKESGMGSILNIVFVLLGYADGIDSFLDEYYIKKMNLTSDQKTIISDLYQNYKDQINDYTPSSLDQLTQSLRNNTINPTAPASGWFSSFLPSSTPAWSEIEQGQLKGIRYPIFIDSIKKKLTNRSSDTSKTIENCPVDIPYIYSILSADTTLIAQRDAMIGIQETVDDQKNKHTSYVFKLGGESLLTNLFSNTAFLKLYTQDMMAQIVHYQKSASADKKEQLFESHTDEKATPSLLLNTDRLLFLMSSYAVKGSIGIKGIQQGVWTIENVLPTPTPTPEPTPTTSATITPSEEVSASTTTPTTTIPSAVATPSPTPTTAHPSVVATPSPTPTTANSSVAAVPVAISPIVATSVTQPKEKTTPTTPSTSSVPAVPVVAVSQSKKESQPKEKTPTPPKPSIEQTGSKNGLSLTFDELLETQEASKYKQYKQFILNASNETDVPPNILLQLMIREGSGGDTHIVAGGSRTNNISIRSPVGLGQMALGARKEMMKKYNQNPSLSKRFDPKSQILQMARYIKFMADQKKCNWTRAMVYYNTGLGVTPSLIPKYKKSNPAIARYMASSDVSLEGYMAAAEKFYSTIV